MLQGLLQKVQHATPLRRGTLRLPLQSRCEPFLTMPRARRVEAHVSCSVTGAIRQM
jgi:hypothetical protein